ncbi:MAG: hypothetical protein I3I98_04610 [Mobilibacterium timonense]|uniref:hypothetical protein n=1 Tax=Mobilibacterium timonense TaxID=1871012 RepID=UPI002356B880|nr:hypothetical protein [Mobilibacterium timonense]MBM6990674.1 hypothetical protein [Mobilibacterium timonense]
MIYKKRSYIMEAEEGHFHDIRKNPISWKPKKDISMIYEKNPISWKLKRKCSMIYEKDPISWKLKRVYSMIYEKILYYGN